MDLQHCSKKKHKICSKTIKSGRYEKRLSLQPGNYLFLYLMENTVKILVLPLQKHFFLIFIADQNNDFLEVLLQYILGLGLRNGFAKVSVILFGKLEKSLILNYLFSSFNAVLFNDPKSIIILNGSQILQDFPPISRIF